MQKEIEAILEQHLGVTDQWGGEKLASWRYGHDVVVDSIDTAAQAIADLFQRQRPSKVQAMAVLIDEYYNGNTWDVPEFGSLAYRVTRTDGFLACECGEDCDHIAAVKLWLEWQEAEQ